MNVRSLYIVCFALVLASPARAKEAPSPSLNIGAGPVVIWSQDKGLENLGYSGSLAGMSGMVDIGVSKHLQIALNWRGTHSQKKDYSVGLETSIYSRLTTASFLGGVRVHPIAGSQVSPFLSGMLGVLSGQLTLSEWPLNSTCRLDACALNRRDARAAVPLLGLGGGVDVFLPSSAVVPIRLGFRFEVGTHLGLGPKATPGLVFDQGMGTLNLGSLWMNLGVLMHVG